MLKVLLIGPLPEPTTGVSLANKVVFESFKKTEGYQIDFINTSLDRFDESLGALSLYKIWFYLKLNFFAYKIFTSKIYKNFEESIDYLIVINFKFKIENSTSVIREFIPYSFA